MKPAPEPGEPGSTSFIFHKVRGHPILAFFIHVLQIDHFHKNPKIIAGKSLILSSNIMPKQ
jgi:hypothetical protein